MQSGVRKISREGVARWLDASMVRMRWTKGLYAISFEISHAGCWRLLRLIGLFDGHASWIEDVFSFSMYSVPSRGHAGTNGTDYLQDDPIFPFFFVLGVKRLEFNISGIK